MPTFEITAPNGSVYDIDGTDEAGALNALQRLLGDQKQPSTANAPSSMLADVAKSGGIGLAKGVNSILGLPGDLRAGVDWLADKAFGPVPEGAARPPQLPLPGSQDVQSAEEAVTGKFYEPKTTAGKYAETIGSFLPGAVTLPGGVAARAANAVRFGVIPGAVSEGAGQLTEGTAAEPYARVAGAVLGAPIGRGLGKLAEAGGRGAGVLPKRPPAPSVDELKAASGAKYEAAFGEPVIIHQQGLKRLADEVQTALTDFSYHPKQQAALKPAVDEILKMTGPYGGNVTLQGLDATRRLAGNAATNIDASTRKAAHIVTEKIDDFIQNLNPSDVIGDAGAATKAASALEEAQTGWRTARKTEIVQDIISNAERASESTGSGGNVNNAIRQGFKNLLNNPKRARNFSKEELVAFRAVSKGTPIDNVARLLGKLGPSGNGLMLALTAAHSAYSPATGIPLAIAGAAAKKFADVSTRNRASEALAKVAGKRGPKDYLKEPVITKFGTFPRTKAGHRALAAAMAGKTAFTDGTNQYREPE